MSNAGEQHGDGGLGERAAGERRMMPARLITHTRKVETPFGNMFVHVEVDQAGRIAGGSISHKGKEPTSQVAQCIEALSDGLRELGEQLHEQASVAHDT